MKPMLLGSAIALSAALLPGAGRAATEQEFPPHNTQELVDLCSSGPGDAVMTAAVNFCHGFMEGVVTVQLEYQAADPRAPKLICLPTPAPTHNDVVAGFVAWAKQNPGEMNDKPADGLVSYLSSQYPCPKPPAPKPVRRR
jgi:hypothetical protein